jgi:hypothetical protein
VTGEHLLRVTGDEQLHDEAESTRHTTPQPQPPWPKGIVGNAARFVEDT